MMGSPWSSVWETVVWRQKRTVSRCWIVLSLNHTWKHTLMILLQQPALFLLVLRYSLENFLKHVYFNWTQVEITILKRNDPTIWKQETLSYSACWEARRLVNQSVYLPFYDIRAAEYSHSGCERQRSNAVMYHGSHKPRVFCWSLVSLSSALSRKPQTAAPLAFYSSPFSTVKCFVGGRQSLYIFMASP